MHEVTKVSPKNPQLSSYLCPSAKTIKISKHTDLRSLRDPRGSGNVALPIQKSWLHVNSEGHLSLSIPWASMLYLGSSLELYFQEIAVPCCLKVWTMEAARHVPALLFLIPAGVNVHHYTECLSATRCPVVNGNRMLKIRFYCPNLPRDTMMSFPKRIQYLLTFAAFRITSPTDKLIFCLSFCSHAKTVK